jgi:hypothetical protein
VKPLSNAEIEALLKPLGNVGKPYYIDAAGNKHYVDSLPAVGGFVSKGPDGRRVYIEGISEIVAYKDKEH